MTDPSPLFDRAGIEDAFRRLGERLARRGVVADLYVFGGAPQRSSLACSWAVISAKGHPANVFLWSLGPSLMW